MPIFDHRFLDQQKNPLPDALMNDGAFLPVQVDIPQILADFLRAKNQQVPSPTQGMALIDTGASKSCADRVALTKLGIKPTGVIRLGTAKGATQCPIFPTRLTFPSLRLRVNFNAMAGVNLQGQQIGGAPLIALVGRDVLRRCLLIYSGANGYFTLSY